MVLYRDGISLRKTRDEDLEFVMNHESADENRNFIQQWSMERHQEALTCHDILHLIIEDQSDKSAGYVILVGLENPSKDITLQRIVVAEKAKGIGRQALKGIKKIVFEDYRAHRLHLVVRDYNQRAKHLYLSEGFAAEGIMRECVLVDGVYQSSVMMSILEKEYFDEKKDRLG